MKIILKQCLIYCLVFLGLFLFRSAIFTNETQRIGIAQSLTETIKVFNDKNTLFDSYELLWNKPYIIKNKNFIENGDFQNGFRNWVSINAEKTTWTKINSKYGNAIRVERVAGEGGFSIAYAGGTYFIKNNTYTISFKYKLLKGSSSDFKIGYWIKEGNHYRNNILRQLTDLGDGWMLCECSYKFKKTYFEHVNFFLNSLKEGTVIEIADVQLHCETCGQKDLELITDKIERAKSIGNNQFYVSRTERYRYALHLFLEEYSFNQKMFGNGFHYLQSYADKFWKGNEKDYPHNIILSSFLYSGLIGGVIYLLFLFMSFYLYIKMSNDLLPYLILYTFAFVFMMFSGNSHFSLPIFTFLSFIPFLANYYRKLDLYKNEYSPDNTR